MKITDFLTPEMIEPSLKGQTKAEVLAELAAMPNQAASGNSRRRNGRGAGGARAAGSTAIGDGIAIPHGKLPKVTKILGTFGRHVQGVDFESLDGNPTHLFFMLVAPEDSTSLHLKALARVSRLLRDGNFREKLLNAPDANELFRLIREEDSKF